MKTFTCECEARIFFRNSRCLACQRELGFLPDRGMHERARGRSRDGGAFGRSRPAERVTGSAQTTLNKTLATGWSREAAEGERFCQSCRLNRVIPGLDEPDHNALWRRIEVAKRHLVYTLLALKLPLCSKQDGEEQGLAFDFLAPTPDKPVLTGHAGGVITLNVIEADPVAREEMRVKMGERYRTLLGHFRHEVGHYYFSSLIEGWAEPRGFSRLFGDERAGLRRGAEAALREPSARGLDRAFHQRLRGAHPWEDWAETWAHYLHMRDTLETAQRFGLASKSARAFIGGGPSRLRRACWRSGWISRSRSTR